MLSLAAAILYSCLAPASAEPVWRTALGPALEEAKTDKRLVLVEFHAPWCYSCYYMEQRVLAGEAFAEAARTLSLVKLDVDTEEGRALKERYAVRMLPTYLLVDGKGREKGRILGEQTERDFHDKLIALERGGAEAGPDAALEKLRGKARKGDLDALEKLLDRPAACETAYDVGYNSDVLEKAGKTRPAKILAAEQAALESLVSQRLLVTVERRCADFRTGIEQLADVYEKLGLSQKRRELLTRAVEAMLSLAKTGEDRNRDDNLRFFLTLLDDRPRLRSFYKELIAAYPTDYVYAYRYAKWLQEKGDGASALPWIDEADKLCYGANRLQVTLVRAKILADLGRKDEAKTILARDAKAGRKNFPKEAAELAALAETL